MTKRQAAGLSSSLEDNLGDSGVVNTQVSSEPALPPHRSAPGRLIQEVSSSPSVPPTSSSPRGNPMEVAMRMLGMRDHSCAEIRTKLESRGFAPEDIEVTIVRLREYGYLDDARYAGVVARSFPSLGRQGLAHQMTKRGIASEHWQMFIDQIDAGEEYERALAVALKHSPPVTLMTIPQEKWQRRLAGYLGRRGFSSSTSLAVCRELHRRAEDLKEAEECE